MGAVNEARDHGPIARFGPFELDRATLELRERGRPVRLASQPAQLLLLLLERGDHVTSRELIRKRLWGDRVVEVDQGINAAVRQIRRALGESASRPRIIETLPKKGYRILTPVTWTAPEDASLEGSSDVSPVGRAVAPLKPPRARATLGWVAAALLLLATTVLLLDTRQPPGSHTGMQEESAETVRLAILPFEDLSPERTAGAFIDGLREDLISELAATVPDHLTVIARASARDRSPTAELQEIAETWHASHVLQGTVRREGDRVRIASQLVRSGDGAHLWARRFEVRSASPLDAQLALAADVARSLVPQLAPPELSGFLDRQLAWDPQAREDYLIARYMLHRGQDRPTALEMLERALDRDPTMAPAWVTLARSLPGFRDPEALARRHEALQRALDLDPRLAEAHEARGSLLLYGEWDDAGAEASFRRAIQLDPSRATSHHALAMLYALQRRFDEAIEQIERARALDPVSMALHTDGSQVYFMAERFDEAETLCTRSADLGAPAARVAQCLYDVYLATGRTVEAAAQMKTLLEIRGAPREVLERTPPEQTAEQFLAGAHEWILGFLQENAGSPVLMADSQLALGRLDDAMRNIEDAAEQQLNDVLVVAAHPRARPLLSHPRLRRVLDLIGFAYRALPPLGGPAHLAAESSPGARAAGASS